MTHPDRDVLVVGVGMAPFAKPSASLPYDELGATAIRLALNDAGLRYETVQQAYAGYVYGYCCAGRRVVYQADMTGIPVFNVINNCATGSTNIFLARQAVESGRRTAC